MFAEHQPKLAELGRSSPDGFERIATFVLLTIRVPLRDAVSDYRLLRRGEHAVRSLFGAKHSGLAYIREHKADLWARCEYVYETSDDETAADVMLGIVSEIPGIGATKAGFILQMIYGLSGCIDTHNLTRFGLSEKHFYYEKRWGAQRRAQHLRDYNKFCHSIGTASLWDGWCNYLAENDPINYASGDRVSSLHLVPLEC